MNLTRHEKIIEIMENHSPIRVKELAAQLGCTEMTVRRNLDHLQEENLIRREHGYAVLLKSARSTDYYEEIHENPQEKEAIAREALRYLTPGASVCLDSGTTIQRLVDLLPADLPLSVITPSLTAAMKLSLSKKIQVYMPAGFLHHKNRSLLIDNPEELNRYQTDIAFLSCRSFQLPGGTFEHSQTLTNTKRSLAAISKKRILLMDYSKWNQRSIFNCLPLSMIHLIITDDKAPQDLVTQTIESGIPVVIAGK